MSKNQWSSKLEKAELPSFRNHEEAINFFEEKYGERFVFEESADIGDGFCFFYRLIIDEEAYTRGAVDLNSNGAVSLEFKGSYELIQIRKDGTLKIGH